MPSSRRSKKKKQFTVNPQAQTQIESQGSDLVKNETEEFPPITKSLQSRKQNVKKYVNIDVDFASVYESNSLREGKIYDGEIVETSKHCFFVLIDKRFRVIVFAERFEETRDKPDVPLTCLVSNGDVVRLTAQRRSNSTRGEEWEAVQCWMELKEATQKKGPKQSGGQIEHRGTLIHVSVTFLHITNPADIIVLASRECIYLYGHRLDKIDLTQVFRVGCDELQYTLEDVATAGVVQAAHAWYGTMCTSRDHLQDTHFMDFCLVRDILTVYRTLVGATEAEKADSGSDTELEYIEPVGQKRQQKRTQFKRSTQIKHPTADGCYIQVAVKPESVETDDMTSDFAHTNTQPVEKTPCILRTAEAVPITKALTIRVQTADVATQTYATGDIFAFFNIAHID